MFFLEIINTSTLKTVLGGRQIKQEIKVNSDLAYVQVNLVELANLGKSSFLLLIHFSHIPVPSCSCESIVQLGPNLS